MLVLMSSINTSPININFTKSLNLRFISFNFSLSTQSKGVNNCKMVKMIFFY